MKYLITLLFTLTLFLNGAPAAASPDAVKAGLAELFTDQPAFETFEMGTQPCGMGPMSNPRIGFCTSQNAIYSIEGFAQDPNASYEMAHVLGHYLQVQYGVADVALREIRMRREEEAALRALVTRQVDCLAGVLMRAGGVAFVPLTVLFAIEPFTDAHWGRDPLNIGPRVSIGLNARAEWYETGYRAGDVAACSVGEISAELLEDGLR